MADYAEGGTVDADKIRSRSKTATLARATAQKRKLDDTVDSLLKKPVKSPRKKVCVPVSGQFGSD
jgi:hypothetical protein